MNFVLQLNHSMVKNILTSPHIFFKIFTEKQSPNRKKPYANSRSKFTSKRLFINPQNPTEQYFCTDMFTVFSIWRNPPHICFADQSDLIERGSNYKNKSLRQH